jgi:antitoxin component of RelBE/YafQ-DinJ toxin-antitoxin module
VRRAKQITFRVSEEEHARLERVAAHLGLSVAEAIRVVVKREDAAIQAAAWSRSSKCDAGRFP